jgi:hypothetical protein
LLAVLVPLGVVVAVHVWFQQHGDVVLTKLSLQPPELVVFLPFLVFHLCGLSVLPILLLDPPTASGKQWLLAFGVMAAAALYWAQFNAFIPSFDKASFFPYAIPMIGPSGPFARHFQVGGGVDLMSWSTRGVLTVLGCLGGTGLILRLANGRSRDWWLQPLMVFTLIQLALMLVAPSLYDRYLVVLLPGAIYAAATPARRPLLAGVPGMFLLLVFGAVSTAMMHDWLSWNRARWRLGDRVCARGVNAHDIEGGLEWNGWHSPVPRPHLVSPDRSDYPPLEPKGLALPITQYFFSHVSGRYALSFSALGGVEVEDSEPYSLWLVPGPHRFYFLRYLPAGE